MRILIATAVAFVTLLAIAYAVPRAHACDLSCCAAMCQVRCCT